MRRIDSIYIHCTDTPARMDIGIDTVRDWHVTGRGWSDVGYHSFIRRDGTAEPGRPFEQEGAHVRGHNAHSIGICMAGGRGKNGLPECNFTAAQWGTLEALVRTLLDRFSLTPDDVYGHNDVSTKACPCFNVREWAKGL